MFPYLLLFSIASILFLNEIKKTNLLILIFLLLFILIAGFRDMIGGFDVYIYAEVYEYYQGSDIFTFPYFEQGYLLYYYLLKFISDDREFMFFVTALIMTLLHYYNIIRHSPNLGMSLFIYFCKFFIFSFIYLRQGLAMGVIWLSISFLLKKKYWTVGLFVIATFYLHKSSIVFVPFLFMAHRRLTINQLVGLAILVLLISLTPLGQILVGTAGEVTDSRKVAIYAKKSGGINFLYLIEGGIGIYLVYIFRNFFYLDKKSTLIFNGFFMYSLTILGGLTNATFIRFSWYYFIFVVLALPYIYYFYQYKDATFKPMFKFLLYSYYALIFLRLLFMFDGGDFMPYKSIFQDFDRNGMWEFMEYRRKTY